MDASVALGAATAVLIFPPTRLLMCLLLRRACARVAAWLARRTSAEPWQDEPGSESSNKEEGGWRDAAVAAAEEDLGGVATTRGEADAGAETHPSPPPLAQVVPEPLPLAEPVLAAEPPAPATLPPPAAAAAEGLVVALSPSPPPAAAPQWRVFPSMPTFAEMLALISSSPIPGGAGAAAVSEEAQAGAESDLPGSPSGREQAGAALCGRVSPFVFLDIDAREEVPSLKSNSNFLGADDNNGQTPN